MTSRCPDACDVVSHPVSLSYTQLSGEKMLDQMDNDVWEKVTNDFLHSKEVMQRVGKQRMKLDMENVLLLQETIGLVKASDLGIAI